jgi:hypothetical protein
VVSGYDDDGYGYPGRLWHRDRPQPAPPLPTRRTNSSTLKIAVCAKLPVGSRRRVECILPLCCCPGRLPLPASAILNGPCSGPPILQEGGTAVGLAPSPAAAPPSRPLAHLTRSAGSVRGSAVYLCARPRPRRHLDPRSTAQGRSGPRLSRRPHGRAALVRTLASNHRYAMGDSMPPLWPGARVWTRRLSTSQLSPPLKLPRLCNFCTCQSCPIYAERGRSSPSAGVAAR